MSIKTLKFCSPCCYAVDGCGDVAICLGADWDTRTVNGAGIMFAKVTGGKVLKDCKSSSACSSSCGCVYEYCIVYDDVQFEINPDTDKPWVPDQGAIVSIGPAACIIQKLLEYGGGGGGGGFSSFTLTADAGTNQTISNGNTLNIAGGISISTAVGATDTVTVNLDLSADADNAAVIGSDGNLYVPEPAVVAETPITANDSPTLDLTASGAENHTLIGNVKISGAGDNILSVDGEGLYVPTLATSCAAIAPFFFSRPNASDECIIELGLCEGSGSETVFAQLDFGPYINNIEEVPAECGRQINFINCAGETEFTLPISDKMYISQAGHGFGASNTLVPLKFSSTPGEYEVADYSSDADVALFVGQVIDSDSFWLLAQGFHVVLSHGYALYTLHAGSSPGAFVEAALLDDTDYIQNAFTPLGANCIYVSLEEAQPPCPVVCCDVIAATGHGFSAGDAVYWDGDSWELAIATDSGVFIVSEVIDVNNFRISLNGCIMGLGGIVAGTEYAVSPDTPGELVDVSTLDPETDSYRCVGVSPANGCLMLNVSPCICQCDGASGGGGGGGGGEEIFFEESFQGTGGGCDVSHVAYVEGDSGSGRDTYTSGVGVENADDASDCVFTQHYLDTESDGDAHFLGIELSPAKDYVGFSFDWGTDGNIVAIGTGGLNGVFFRLQNDDGAGNLNANPRLYLQYNSGGQFEVRVLDGDSGDTTYNDDGLQDNSLDPDTWYRISGHVQASSVLGASDGEVYVKVEELQGDTTTGSDGTVIGTVYEYTFSNVATAAAGAALLTWNRIDFGQYLQGFPSANDKYVYTDNIVLSDEVAP